MSLLIKNAKAMIGGELERVDILCDAGKIKRVAPHIDEDAKSVIDAKNKIIIPGAIDCHVHIREPGQEYKEDFLTGSKAAAAGGVTSMLAMPNTSPPVTTCEVLDQEKALAGKSIVHWGCYMGASGEDNAEEIAKAKNVPGVKIYLDVTTGHLKIDDPQVIMNVFKSRNVIAVHAENEKVLECIERIKRTDHKLYLAHITTKEEVEMIRLNKDHRVFAEVTPHHLYMTQEDVKRLGSYASMKPELKTREDVQALWQALADGTIDTVGTDHAPHTVQEKESKSPPWGVPGLQTMLPLMLDAVHKKKITLSRLVEVICENPARIFNIKNKGYIKEGFDADLTIIDMDLEKAVRNEDQFSKCAWTPFDKKVLKGWPIATIVSANVIFLDGKIIDETPASEIDFT